MENLLGVAKSYLEENGIDTSMMTEEEIIDKYHSMLTEELSELEEEVSAIEEEISDVEDAINEEAEPEIETEEQPETEEVQATEEIQETEEVQATEEVDNSEDSLTQFLNDNAELIETFNEEQKAFLEQLISIKR